MEKTQQEILDRIAHVKESDWMGTTQSDLIDFLDYDNAKQFLKPETTEETWKARGVPPPMEQAKNYLDFAWGKANGCRGLSAGRSLDHLKAWLWLAGHGAIVDENFDDYEHYGKFQLVIASELTGFDWQSADDGEWVNDEDGPAISAASRQTLIDRAREIAATAVAA